MKTKNNGLKAIVMLAMVLLAFSCTKEYQDNPTNNIDKKDKPQSFKELGLIHSYPTPIEALDYSVTDLQAMYLEENGLKSTSIDEVGYPSLEEMAVIVEKNIGKYPDVYEMDSADYEMVKLNFPSLTDEEIFDNYTKNLQHDVILCIIEENLFGVDTKLKSGDGDYLGTDLYKKEFWYLSTKPRATLSIKDAKEDAWQWAIDYYGTNSGQDQSDAFRHIAWNTLIAKYHAEKKKSIEAGITLAKEFTDLHEQCNKEVDGAEVYDCEMDYHNNWIGRDYFESIASIVKKGLLKYLICPSNGTIKSTIKGKVDNGRKVDKTVAAVKAVSKYTPVYFK